MLVGVLLIFMVMIFLIKVQNGSIMHDNKIQNGNRIAKIAQGRTYHNGFINYTCLCFIITFSRTTLTSQELLSMYIPDVFHG